MVTDIAIIGGGASGLTAAISAKEANRSAKVTIVEKLPRTGKKIIASGNGRCNLSHTPISASDYSGSVPTAEILAGFGDASDFFESLVANNVAGNNVIMFF